MNKYRSFLVIALSPLLFSACNQKKVSDRWVTYKDPRYPITVEHKIGAENDIVEVSALPSPGLHPIYPGKTQNAYWIRVAGEFTNASEDGTEILSLYWILFYKTEKELVASLPYGLKAHRLKEEKINGIPVVLLNGENIYDGGILIIPALYAKVEVDGITKAHSDQSNPKLSDRVSKRTLDAIKRFRWEGKSIDTQSEEFKKWREHIWDLVTKNSKSVERQN